MWLCAFPRDLQQENGTGKKQKECQSTVTTTELLPVPEQGAKRRERNGRRNGSYKDTLGEERLPVLTWNKAIPPDLTSQEGQQTLNLSLLQVWTPAVLQRGKGKEKSNLLFSAMAAVRELLKDVEREIQFFCRWLNWLAAGKTRPGAAPVYSHTPPDWELLSSQGLSTSAQAPPAAPLLGPWTFISADDPSLRLLRPEGTQQSSPGLISC